MAKKTTSTPTGTKPARKPKKSNAGKAGASRGAGKAGFCVRMYRVGFGDFFLVSVPTSNGLRYILVDCGVHGGSTGTIEQAVRDVADQTKNHLSLIIVSHRHADHISGFASCAEIFRNIEVDEVWMPWWDDPKNKGAHAFQAALTRGAARLAMRLRMRLGAGTDGDIQRALTMANNITGEPLFAAAKKEKINSNDAALRMLRGVPTDEKYHFRNNPVRRYFKAGDMPELPPDLVGSGLVARILGPPTDATLVSKMDSKPHQYLDDDEGSDDAGITCPFPGWSLQRSDLGGVLDAMEARRRRLGGKGRKAETDEPRERPLEKLATGDLEKLIDDQQGAALLAAAEKADETVNNQSLVVHFTFAERTYLFAGDAQWGSWSNLLFGRGISGKQVAPLLPETREMLANLDFYKVGHHGSTNATPKDMVAAMREGCVAMCSTEPDVHGKLKSNGEVPRGFLMDALMQRTKNQLVRSDQVVAGKSPPTNGLPSQLPAGFTTSGELYIDYKP